MTGTKPKIILMTTLGEQYNITNFYEALWPAVDRANRYKFMQIAEDFYINVNAVEHIRIDNTYIGDDSEEF